ncbi:spermidine synthase [Nannocystis pusilla]|uniref:Fused MFS/spermidine synthase n=1 Tax=Nannocystis pusilla TaxID=889268 RepID=A0ABS7TLS2_9BACT|nr:fused MFS/spermidine synthase [Nannocystis pusilla]
MLLFALTIFLSAFLLFQVQPLIGKIILPWFGGTPAVWTTCMLFFQCLLLAGYAYAHAVMALPARRQGLVHLAVLVAALLAGAPTIFPPEGYKPEGDGVPLLQILLVLTVSVGLPYFALSTTGSLVQAWFSRLHPSRSPYPLYALSNIGSLLGLLTFPFLVEPRLGSVTQASLWFLGFAGFCLLCGTIAVQTTRASARAAAEPAGDLAGAEVLAPTWGLRAVWVALGACASIMLLAMTNQMAIDVASVPFLWVIPLALYLMSFILCFSSERWYPRWLFYPLFVGATAGVVGLMLAGADAGIEQQALVYCAAIFIYAMVCHGELYRLRPHPRHLTAFYLALSVGGALGGVFVGAIAPLVFSAYYELHIGLVATSLLVLHAFRRDQRLELPGRGVAAVVLAGAAAVAYTLWRVQHDSPDSFRYIAPLAGALLCMLLFGFLWSLRVPTGPSDPVPMDSPSGPRWIDAGARINHGRARLAWLLPIAAIVLLAVNLVIEARYRTSEALTIERGFFGVLRVADRYTHDPLQARRILFHGAINHGFQYLDRERQMWHNSYFAEESGIGTALTRHPKRRAGEPLKIGLLGLGSGTLLTYGRPGDSIRIYEIDPEVEPLSRRYFTYFERTEAATEVVLGDGRLSLEREPDQAYDVLILDAFSSDAIPMHLLTREAFETYFRHLEPDGILAANMSNRHVDIRPVLKQLAQHFAREFVWIENHSDDPRGVYAADWGLLSNNRAFLDDPLVKTRQGDTSGVSTDLRMWTDDYSNLFAVLKWVQGG